VGLINDLLEWPDVISVQNKLAAIRLQKI